MRTWQGYREDTSVVSDEGLLTAQNISFKVSGEIRRRPGLDGRVDQTGTLVTEWTDPFTTPYLVYNNSGSLVSVNVLTTSGNTLATALSTLQRGCFAKSNGRLYFTNDFNAMQRIERGNATAGTAGIAGPTAAIGTPTTVAGSCTAGTHGMRYRYYDSKSLYLSDPSSQTNIVLTGASDLTFSIGTGGQTVIRSQDSKVDQVIIELTDAGSSTFYRAATVNQSLTGTTISIADTDLRNQVTAARDGDFSHQQPPLTLLASEHRGRLFAWGAQVVTLTGVTVSSSSANVTVTGSTMSSGWAGRLARFGTDTKAYRIAAMSGTGLANLSETYTGTSAVVSGAQFFSATPDMLYWTRSGFPESWNTTSFARRVLQNASDIPSAMFSHNEVLYLCGQRTIRILDYDKDPALGKLDQVPGDFGVWNQRCVVEANGRIYAWGRSGIFTMNGMSLKYLSDRLDVHIDGSDTTSTDNYDVSKYEQFHGVFDPVERTVLWFYATSSETYPKHAIVYDIDSQEWMVGTWKQSMRASCLSTGGSTNRTRALVADENGYSWYLTAAAFDGVPSVLSGGVLTVNGTGSTTTNVNVTQSLPTGTSNMLGVVIVYSSTERYVVSNTATSLLLNSALTAAPTAGSELFAGQINFTAKTKWVSPGLENKQRPSYFFIYLVPGSATGQITIKFYTDYATTAKTLTKGASDVQPDGLTWTNGANYVTVDMDGGSGDGVAFMPLFMDWQRAISAEVSSTRPKDQLKIIDFGFSFKNPRSVVEVEDE